jgi:hypothetical protein
VSAPARLSSSLQANGSGECTPDDNLREAIQRGVGKADLLPRYARRIDGGVLASERANGK